MSQTPPPEEGMPQSEQPGIDQEIIVSQTSSSEWEISPSEQPDIDQGIATSQTSSPEERMPPSEQLDIGPGGIILDSPNNREVLERIERARPLSPIELYVLAVSYQQVVSNSGLGNRLGFVGLSTILQNLQRFIPELFLQSDDASIQTNFAIESFKWKLPCTTCCGFSGFTLNLLQNSGVCDKHCVCPRTSVIIKSIPHAGLELLVEVTQVEESKTYVVLGVSPNILEVKTAV